MVRIAAYRPDWGAIVSAGVTPSTPFHDLGDFVALPRVTALRLAPDGTWLAAAVQTLSADKKKYLTSIWRIDAQGGPARRLTRSAEGEGSPRFLPDGSLLFTSGRPDPAAATGPDGERGDVSAPVRFWDHDLGPDQTRLFAVDPDQVLQTEIGWVGGDKEPALADDAAEGAERAPALPRLRDLTPEPGRALDGEAFELTPDGT